MKRSFFQPYFFCSFLMAILLGLPFSSCKKLVDVPPPQDRIGREAVFASEATALSATTGLYTEMMKANLQLTSIGMTLFAGLSGDELYNSVASAEVDEFTRNALSASNGMVRSNLWVAAYKLIFHANSILEGLQGATGVSGALKSQLRGEALVVRAFLHFYLANLYGDVPYILSTDYRTTAHLGRLPVGQVYEQAVQDLREAQQLLTPGYPSPGRVRPNQHAATALLARIYLYGGNWAGAEAEASKVIGAGLYTLASNVNAVFLAGSSEALWQLLPAGSANNTWEGNVFIPGSAAVPAYPLTQALVAAFEPGDKRMAAWTKTATLGSSTFYYPYKYKVRSGTPVTEYYTVLRLAEVYLIRAEARARLNKIPEGVQDLNVIRTRAGLPASNASDAPSLLAALEQERRVELAFEWGHRWLDLKRTGKADAVLKGQKGDGWQPTDVLYPIPHAEILANPALTQNPGY